MSNIRSMLCISMGVLAISGSAYAEIVQKHNDKLLMNEQKKQSQIEEKIILSSVEFDGNEIYKDKELQSLISTKLGTEVSLNDLNKLAADIQRKYHDDGYLITKVLIPQQEFSDNLPVKIIILEGKLGKINIIGNKNYKSKFINQSLSASEIVSGKAFTVDSLENTLARINKQSGIRVSSILRQGDQQGYTDLDVKVTESEKLSSVLEVNNYGSKNTGEYRAIGQINVNNVTGRGDTASLVGMHTVDGEGAYFVNLAYNTPINSLGTKLGAYYSFGNVNVGKELAVLDIQGENKGWGLGIQQDYILDVNNLIQYEAWLESSDVKQDILGMKMTEDKIRKLRLGVNFEHLNKSSRSFYSLNLHQGLGDKFGAMEDGSEFSTRAISYADNNFTKLTFDWMRLQRLTSRVILIPRLYAQYGFDSLVSGEQIAIGGYNSVIGNPNSTYSGDSGYNLNLEGRYSILPSSDKYQFTAKLDYGQVFVKKSFLNESNQDDLAGISIGLMAQPYERLSLKVDYGQAVKHTDEKDNYLYMQAKFTY